MNEEPHQTLPNDNDAQPSNRKGSTSRRIAILCALIAIVAGSSIVLRGRESADSIATAPDLSGTKSSDETQSITVPELLDIANQTYDAMGNELGDYTATFTQQWRDPSGVLGDPEQIQVKIQTKLRNESNDAPMRVYLKFDSGREVIWGADLYDGKLAAHETSALLAWKTFYLDPEGMLAMQGQQFPIWEIGLVRLAEQLIERGKNMESDPHVTVQKEAYKGKASDGQENQGVASENIQLFRITRSQPSEEDWDFSVAEVVIDFDRSLVLMYRSFGWPEADGDSPPLIEFYEYENIKTNVGLTKEDFAVTNPDYNFPEGK